MSKKAAKDKKAETTAERLRRRISEYQSEKNKSLRQLEQLTAKLGQLDGAIYALGEELKAEESQ